MYSKDLYRNYFIMVMTNLSRDLLFMRVESSDSKRPIDDIGIYSYIINWLFGSLFITIRSANTSSDVLVDLIFLFKKRNGAVWLHLEDLSS